jgi:hypothetical protein
MRYLMLCVNLQELEQPICDTFREFIETTLVLEAALCKARGYPC